MKSAAEIRKSAGETTGALRGTGGGCPADSAPTSTAAKERLERAWGDIYEQDAKEDALGKPVPVESLLDEDDFAVIREEQASSVATRDGGRDASVPCCGQNLGDVPGTSAGAGSDGAGARGSDSLRLDRSAATALARSREAASEELAVLRAAGEPLTASQIADRLGYGIGRGTSVGNQLRRLRESSLVEKSDDVPARWWPK